MKIFISYRRDDDKGFVDHIVDYFIREYGKESVFQDSLSLEGGDHFREEIRNYIHGSDIVVVIIGLHWQSERLSDADDMVCFEIETAIETDIPIIPILINQAPMPTEKELPENIQGLRAFHAITVRHFPNLSDDMRIVFGAIKKEIAKRRTLIKNKMVKERREVVHQYFEIYQKQIRIMLIALIMLTLLCVGSNLLIRHVQSNKLVSRPKPQPTAIPSTYVTNWNTWKPGGQWKIISDQQVIDNQMITNIVTSDGSSMCCNPNNIGLLAPTTIHASNYTVQAEIQVTGINRKATSNEVYFGLLVHSDMNFDGYLMGLLYDGTSLQNGTTFLSILGLGTGLQLGQMFVLDSAPHLYSIQVQGYSTRFFIDGKLMIQVVNDTDSHNSGFGLMDAGYQIKVLSFSLTTGN